MTLKSSKSYKNITADDYRGPLNKVDLTVEVCILKGSHVMYACVTVFCR